MGLILLKLWKRKRLTLCQRARDRRRAVRALGKPLKRTQPVHHHDFKQLVICESHAYHMLLHEREIVVRHGKNPNTHKYVGYPLCLVVRNDFKPKPANPPVQPDYDAYPAVWSCQFCGHLLKASDTYCCPECGWKLQSKGTK